MTNQFLQMANQLLSETIKEKGKSSKYIYDQLSQFFRLPNDNEEDFLLKRGYETLPCRYQNEEVFRNQTRRITQIEVKKLSNTKKNKHPEIRLSIDSLLAVQLFSILGINIDEFLNTVAYRMGCEELENNTAEQDNEVSNVVQQKQRKETHSLEELYKVLITVCGTIKLKTDILEEKKDLNNLSDSDKDAANLFFEQLIRDIRSLEQIADTSTLEKSQIKKLHPKVKRNVDKLGGGTKEQEYFDISNYFVFEESNEPDTINYLEIRPQLYVYASYLIICILRDFLKRLNGIQTTAEKQFESQMRIKFFSMATQLSESISAQLLHENTNSSKIGIVVLEKDVLCELTEIFRNIKAEFDELLAYFSKTTSTSFDDVKEEKKLREFLGKLAGEVFEIFKNPTLNFRNPRIVRYNSVQDILRKKKFFDYTFKISDEKIKSLKSLEELARNTCTEIKNDIVKYAIFDEPEMTTLQKDAQDYIFKAMKENISPIIALDMGNGKTRVACSAIRRFITENKEETGYILVIIPSGLVEDWISELNTNHIPKIVPLTDGNRKNYYQNGSIKYVSQQVFITTYDIAANDFAMFKNDPPVMIVYDELQMINTIRILDKCLILSELNEDKRVNYKFALTGTPMQNNTMEFFINYCFFHDGKLLLEAKNANLVKSDSWEQDERFKIVKKELKNKKFYYFGGEDLKLKIDENFIPLVFQGEHAEKYKEYLKAPYHTQMQFLLNPKDYDCNFDSAKILFVKQFVKELSAKNEKVIIFSYYKNPLRYLYKELQAYNPVIAIGKSAEDSDDYEDFDTEAKKEIEKFKDLNKKYNVLLGTIKMIGTGENLQVANNIIILDLWWNPMVIIQAMFRIKRKKQNKPVHIYFPIYTNEKCVAIDIEQNFLNTMKQKIDSYNLFLQEMGYNTGKRTLPETCLKKPLIFDQSRKKRFETSLFDKLNSENSLADALLFGKKVKISPKAKEQRKATKNEVLAVSQKSSAH